MSKNLWLMSAAICMFPFASCVSRGAFEQEKSQREVAVQKWNELSRYQQELESDRRALKHEVEQLRLLVDEKTKTAEDASSDRTRYREKLEELEKRLGAFGDASSGDVEVFHTAEGTVVEIKEGVLFDSGQKDIKAKGKEILARLAEEIAKNGCDVRIEGHTDADPVVKHSKEYPMGNLQLSALRALEVAHFVTKGTANAIPESRVYVAGFGPNRPRVEGNDAESKRKNRRVDLVVLRPPAGDDKAPSDKPAAVDAAATGMKK